MFDRFMGARRPSWRRRALLVGSLVAHGGLVVALLVGSWLRVAELTPPLLAVVFNPVAEPPPHSSSPPKAKPHRERHAAATEIKRATVQPRLDQPPATEPRVDPGDKDRNEPPGDDDRRGPPGKGGENGLPCTGSDCISAPAPRPRNVAPHALDAERIAGAMPHLPPQVIDARRGLGDAAFTARICVGQSGAVSSVTVLAGIPGADDAIVAALRSWRYKPQPIPVCFISQFLYDIQN